MPNLRKPQHFAFYGSLLSFSVFLLGLLVGTARAQNFQALTNFEGNNGQTPLLMSLIQGPDGNFYGVTVFGGREFSGNVFKLTPGGNLAVVHGFSSRAYPLASLLFATDGNFYGTTAGRPLPFQFCGGFGGFPCGSIFMISADGEFKDFYRIGGGGNDIPTKLVESSEGNLYGADSNGIFTVASKGAVDYIHFYCSQPNCADGSSANTLIQAADGNFYDTTQFGANTGCPIYPGTYPQGCGTVFKMTAGGALTTLYSFSGPDGGNPMGALVQDADGVFYGATINGGPVVSGCPNGCGTIFKITSAGKLTSIPLCTQFNCPNGSHPYAGLILATDGNLYGTAYTGGAYNGGTVFKVSPTGTISVVHSFGLNDGAGPKGGLLQATRGLFYGTTVDGGGRSCTTNYGCGTIFSFSEGLSPFVTFVRASGKVGQTAGILGQGFTGTSGVSFDGIPAKFTIVSDTYLTATVPPGATTGYAGVNTPSGTLTSNVPFHVVP